MAKKTIEDYDKALKEAHVEHDKTGKRITALNNCRQKLIEVKLLAEMPDPITPKWIMSLDWKHVPVQVATAVENWFWDNQNGVCHSGYVLGGSQMVPQIKLHRGRPLKDQLGIIDFARYIKSKPKKILILEHDYSTFGTYYVEKCSKSNWRIIRNNYVIHEERTLRKLLEYIYEYHWWE